MNMKDLRFSKMKMLMIAVFAFAAFFIVSPASSEAGSDKNLGDILLYEGKEHPHVSELQGLLTEKGFLNDNFTEGVYDSPTRKAVAEFQKSADILVDGITGPQTAGALKVLRAGDEGEAVAELQKRLHNLGYYPANLDGIFGPVTEKSVRQFQKDEGIIADGIAGPQTFGALYSTGKSAAVSAVNNTAEVNSDGFSGTASAEESKDSKNSSESPDNGNKSAKSDGETKESQPKNNTADEADENTSDSPESDDTVKSSASSTSEQQKSSDSEKQEEINEEQSNQSEEKTETASRGQSSGQGRVLTMEATAYTAYCNGCSGITATGIDLRNNPGKKVVAVDPNIIPLGTMVEVEGYGTAIAGDTGGAIKGNKIDLFMPNRDDALKFGRRNVQVTILE
ncbi:peptidoglycan-binding protein [Evansella sp. LMS18]|uniref:peptidoglycan-binding protein n=1 Tax=Evansella sp. LMS18 TaxID=2924033 RepID=UPI0026EBCA46|nr:peptidoglycan-binding protein [Evansella sp. LMS18]